MDKERTYPQKFLGCNNLLLQGLQDRDDGRSLVLLSCCLLQSPEACLKLALIHIEEMGLLLAWEMLRWAEAWIVVADG